jgi:hypothetical protein
VSRISSAVAALLATLIAGCATYHAYDGAQRSRAELALIEGSAKFRSEVPVALVIRSVDGREVDLRYASVAVLPGTHVIVVDCQVGGTAGSTSRHGVKIDVPAGSRHRLLAQMAPGNRSCESVELAPTGN